MALDVRCNVKHILCNDSLCSSTKMEIVEDAVSNAKKIGKGNFFSVTLVPEEWFINHEDFLDKDIFFKIGANRLKVSIIKDIHDCLVNQHKLLVRFRRQREHPCQFEMFAVVKNGLVSKLRIFKVLFIQETIKRISLKFS